MNAPARKASGELMELMTRLTALQERLHASIREKLEAMRRADVDAMLASARAEGRVVSEISALETDRKDVVRRLGVALGMNPALAGAATIRQLADRLDTAVGRRLMQAAGALRERMLRVAEANRVVELVSREMLAHFRTLFSIMAGDETGPTYSAAGRMAGATGPRVLDSVV
jgi:hypothetical protein